MCGLNLFVMALQAMKPQLIIDHQSKEREMEDLTTESFDNNVRTYLSKMQEMQNEIDSLWKYWIKYDEQCFLPITFNELGETAGYFLVNIKRQSSNWVKNPAAFNTSTFIDDMINLYTNYKSTGDWDKQGADHNKFLFALATSLKQ